MNTEQSRPQASPSGMFNSSSLTFETSSEQDMIHPIVAINIPKYSNRWTYYFV